jgi:hypothetical protein
MSTKDFESALVEMVVNYVKMQEKKKQKEILSQIVSRVAGKGGGAGGEESETEEKAPKEKRAPSAYNLFMKDIRALIVEKNPGLKPQEVTTEIGRVWHIKQANPEMTNEQVIEQAYPEDEDAAPAPAPAPTTTEKKVVPRKAK